MATALGFALDHARALEAVEVEMDVARLSAPLEAAGLPHHIVTSAVNTRDEFITLPDWGRQLPQD